MSYPFPTDLLQLVERHLNTGRYSSEDDLLRDALQALSEREEDLIAIQQAIDEWQSGDDGVPLKESIAQIRNRIGTENSE